MITPADSFLRDFAETRGFLLGRPGRFALVPDGGALLYLRTPARSTDLGLYELDLKTGRERTLCTAADVLAPEALTLSDAEKARRERQRITDAGFTHFELGPDGGTVLLPLGGRLFHFDRGTQRARALLAGGGSPVIDPRFSPDGRTVAFVRDNDVHVVDVATAAERQLTFGGSEDTPNGVAEFVAQEEMARFEGHWWAPHGRTLAFAAVDQTMVERFSIADPAQPERPPVTFRYPRPGHPNARVRLGLVDVNAGAPPRFVVWDDARWPYLARVAWQSARAPLVILVQSRDQREAALLAVDEATGATRVLRIEHDPAWLNLDRGLPRWLPDGSGLLLASDADGPRALHLIDATGTSRQVIVPAGFHSLAHVHADARAVTVLEGDALTTRLVRVALDTGARTVLLDDGGEHEVVFARDGSLFVDTRVAADALPSSRVWHVPANGPAAPSFEVPSAVEPPPFGVNLTLTAVDARPPGAPAPLRYHAALVRPRAFDAQRRYPVVVHVYGGPHAQVVKADMRNYLMDQWIADHGAIVVAIDNRGTPRRDRVWERAIKGNFASPALDDQVAALQALAAEHPELDLSRVGIFGWSFGGFMAALAVLKRPDVFHCAVAGAPVVDWLDYDTHYTERYLDLPAVNPAGYHASSLLPLAPSLSRPLLLVHGTADDNVYFFHSLKLANALFRAGRRFDFLPLPRVTHQIGDPTVRERVWERMTEYLFQHLGLAPGT